MAGKAWDPIAAQVSPEDYGRYCAWLANTHRPDCLIPANEPNIEWRSLFNTPDSTPGQYQALAGYLDRVLAEYRRHSAVPIQFPANSPGHLEDDGPLGGQYLAPVAAKYDELGLHIYWPKGGHTNEWYGGRWRRLFAVYRPKHRVVITEFNREAAGDDEALAAEVVEWVASLDRRITDACWFIGDSPDPAFHRLTLRGRQPLLSAFQRLNTAKDLMHIDIAIAQSGGKVTVDLAATPAITGGFTVFLHVDPKDDNTAYAIDQYRFTPAMNGKARVEFDVPQVPAGVGGSIRVNFLGFDNGQVVTGEGETRVQSFGAGGPERAPAPEPAPAPAGSLDLIHQLVGDAVNRLDASYSEQRERLLDIHRAIAGEPLAFPQAR
jgi:hypothetical protein